MLSNIDISEAAQRLTSYELLVLDNGPVYALAGNANDPDLQARIQAVKDRDAEGNISGQRGLSQPVGWTVPFSHALDAVDVSQVYDARMRRILEDPHELTGRIGALAFLRATADMEVKRARNIPDSIIPNVPGATVQIYSPTGNDGTSKIVRLALALGAEPVMTSANVTSKPEIVEEYHARKFAEKVGGLAVYVQCHDTEKGFIRGSYPIIGIREDSFTLERAGCFHAGIIAALLNDLPFHPLTVEGKQPRPAKHPDEVLHLTDLPMQYRGLKGTDLWFGVLATLGWHDELVDMAQEAIPDVTPSFPRRATREAVLTKLLK